MARRHSFESDNNEDDEYRPIIVRNYRPSFWGRVRTVNNIRSMEWYFIFFSIALITIGFCFTFLRMFTIDLGSDQFLFAILVVINLSFAGYYLVHSILQEQPFEIFTYILTTLIIAVLVTINFTSAETEDYMIRVIRFVITVFLSVPNIALALRIGRSYWDSGLFIFKTVGGDLRLQRMCRVYLFSQSLLVFDLQAMFSCAILVMRDGFAGMTHEQTYLLVTGMVFAILWLCIGYAGMRYENTPVTWIFAVISIVQPLYVLYLYVEGLDQIKEENSIRTNSAYFAGFVLLLAHFTLCAILPMVMSNYRKGLKEAIYGMDPPPFIISSNSGINPNPDFRHNILIIPPSHLNYDAILPADDVIDV